MSAQQSVECDFLTSRQVAARLRIGLRTVWSWTRGGILPKPFHLGPRLVRWRAADIQLVIDRAARGER